MKFRLFINKKRSIKNIIIFFITISICLAVKLISQDSTLQVPPHLQKYLLVKQVTNLNHSYNNIEELRKLVEKINSKQNLGNVEKFQSIGDDTPILVIQVHRDINRLQWLVISLAQVQGIQTALLIFSHSYYHELHPHKFPGIDPDDCTPGLSEPMSTTFCLIRDARLTEHKQHWWWKANFIFRRMKWSTNHRNPVIFLEEDNFVAPDLLHIYQYVQRSFKYFPWVEVLSFGGPWTRNVNIDKLTIESWRPPHDIGFAFNKTTWKKIMELSAQFCMYNEYSWSYSLLHLFLSFSKGHVDMMRCMAPRVLSTKKIMNTNDILKNISQLFDSLELFPEKVEAVYLFGPEGRVERVFKSPSKGKGGWNDVRDQLLCLDPLLLTTTEEERYDDADFFKI